MANEIFPIDLRALQPLSLKPSATALTPEEKQTLVHNIQLCRDAIVFFTYLYHPTYCGLLAAPARSVLVPTAHDEPPLRFGIYDALFASARAFAFCSAPEMELVRSHQDVLALE